MEGLAVGNVREGLKIDENVVCIDRPRATGAHGI
jgi:hypothetical protein